MLVMKFGGASVATPDRFSRIAKLIKKKLEKHKKIVVVVSAMGDTTDQLLTLARQVHDNPPRRELDMLLSVGERISIALLAMALSSIGVDAVSFTGSQSGIITCDHHSDARILSVSPYRLLSILEKGQVAIVAGFQGVSRKGEITTLGRGGSDTTAVALAVALRFPLVEFYKDVSGIYNADPKKDPSARLLPELSYEEALALAENGAKVLHPRCIALAAKNGIRLSVLSFKDPDMGGTRVGSNANIGELMSFEEVCAI